MGQLAFIKLFMLVSIPTDEVAESKLSSKDEKMIMHAIDNNWDFINEQITRCFNGEKTTIKNIE